MVNGIPAGSRPGEARVAAIAETLEKLTATGGACAQYT
jgi:NAD/NADP transhydrogenase alpha subunit